MAFALDKRSKILAGVVGLVAVCAAAWFFFLDDFLNAPPPKPVASPPAAPAKAAAKADAGKAGPAKAESAKADAAAKAPAAPAKPIPTDPAKLVAEVVAASGLRQSLLVATREVAVNAVAGDAPGEGPAAADAVAAAAAAGRQFDDAMVAEVAATLKSNLDAERMSRFLELLRQPAVATMVAKEASGSAPEAMREAIAAARKAPVSAERGKLVQSLDDMTRRSELGGDMANAMARAMVDTMLDAMKKGGKGASADDRQAVGARLNTIRSQARGQIRAAMTASVREASDAEFAEFLKVMDTDTGRWGLDRLAEASRPALMGRATQIGKDIAQIALARRAAPAATAKVPDLAEPSLPKASTPVPEPKAAPEARSAPVAAAPAAPVGYQRPPNIKELYGRYNDIVTATVMRDRAAVKELLDDGKSPNQRQADGSTLLMIAVSNGDMDIVALLLDKGADPNARAAGGVTALSIARSRGAAGGAAMVQQLQRAGAKE